MNLILGFDTEKSKVKVKALTLTYSNCSVKSENQTVSEDYENYIFRNWRENEIYWYIICDFWRRIGFTMNY